MGGSTKMTVAGMRTWLVDRVAYHLDQDAAIIKTNIPLAAYGMDSVYAMSVSGDIEQEFGLELDVTVLWDQPTIDALTDHIIDKLGL